jgi:hypothetical protein
MHKKTASLKGKKPWTSSQSSSFYHCTLPLSLILLELLVPPESHPPQQSHSVSPEDAAVAPHAALQSPPKKWRENIRGNSRKMAGEIAGKMARKFKT